MKQASLFSYAKHGGLDAGTPVVDLFCGIGGFSCGAEQASHRVVLAVDSDPFLLGCHVRNNPDCEHVCCELPRADLPLPTAAKWHLHGSPPCTKLSIMSPIQDTDVRQQATDMVKWYLEFALASGATSWSMEQVNHASVRSELVALKSRFPMKLDWGVFDAVDFDVPQYRRRIIAGSPFLIANLRTFQSRKRKRLTVRDAIANPPRSFIRNSLYSRPDHVTGELKPVPLKDQVRSIDHPSFTVLSTGHLKFSDSEGNVLRHFRAHEKALLQTFPRNYMLPLDSQEALVGVGNAVPPRLAQILMQPTGGL